jgi:hypothetical protein
LSKTFMMMATISRVASSPAAHLSPQRTDTDELFKGKERA